MLKKEALNRVWPLLIFFLLVSVLHWQLKLSLIFFWFGIFLGGFLLEADQVIYCFFQEPQEFSSQRFRRFVELRQWTAGLRFLLDTRQERKKIIFHSVLFQIILLAVSFFVLTSSQSYFGKGLVLSLLLTGLVEQGRQLLKDGQINSWFWQFKFVPSHKAQVYYFCCLAIIFVVFSLFFV